MVRVSISNRVLTINTARHVEPTDRVIVVRPKPSRFSDIVVSLDAKITVMECTRITKDVKRIYAYGGVVEVLLTGLIIMII